MNHSTKLCFSPIIKPKQTVKPKQTLESNKFVLPPIKNACPAPTPAIVKLPYHTLMPD